MVEKLEKITSGLINNGHYSEDTVIIIGKGEYMIVEFGESLGDDTYKSMTQAEFANSIIEELGNPIIVIDNKQQLGTTIEGYNPADLQKFGGINCAVYQPKDLDSRNLKEAVKWTCRYS